MAHSVAPLVELTNPNLLNAVLDTLGENLVVLDQRGTILYSNRSWDRFALENQCDWQSWDGVDYLEVCDRAAESGDETGKAAAEGIREVIAGRVAEYMLVYPCHSPSEQRWFQLRVALCATLQEPYVLVEHQNITLRKMAELEVQELARLDGLTGIANRRAFDETIDAEWRRCARSKAPLSLAMVDIDFFKYVNDSYGHQTGDEFLRRVAKVVGAHANRASDLAARYGGEEFALVMGDTGESQALQVAERLRLAVADLDLPNKRADTAHLTVSIGVATAWPSGDSAPAALIEKADAMLYEAKDGGRNQVRHGPVTAI